MWKNKLTLILIMGCMGISLSNAQQLVKFEIKDTQKNPLMGAVLQFNHQYYVANSEGIVKVSAVKEGNYPITVDFLGFQKYQKVISIQKSTEIIPITMEEASQKLSEVVVVGKALELSLSNQIVEIIPRKTITKDASQSLSEALSKVQGVSMIQSGATVAKPVIHGMHSNRIVILNNEIRQEGQQWGLDHAPEIDPLMAERIKVVKGAESVRYGADALGGIVLVEPAELPYHQPLKGRLLSGFASNGEKYTSSVSVGSGLSAQPWAWRLQGSWQHSSDIKTAEYYLNNTGVRQHSFTLSTGWKKSKWGSELYYSWYQSKNGVFLGSHIGNLNDLKLRFQLGRPMGVLEPFTEVVAPKQEVAHQLLKYKGFVNFNERNRLSFIYAFQKNQRKEYSVRRMDRTQIPALDMSLRTHSMDVNFENHQENWKTELGLNGILKQNYNEPGTGVVPLIPNYASASYAFYAIEKYQREHWGAEAGVRYDYQEVDADGYDINGQRYGGRNYFHNFSYSLGTHWDFHPHWRWTSQLGWAWRAPDVSELYSNGLHHGVGTYEVGDPNLTSEKGLKWLNSLHYQSEKWRFQADVFVQKVWGYIYDTPTQELRTLFSGVYPVFEYQQSDAFFRGTDVSVRYQLMKPLSYILGVSAVYANDVAKGSYFPFIPSEKITQELKWEQETDAKVHHWEVALGHQFVAHQSRFDPKKELVSTTPDAYHLWKASAGLSMRIHTAELEAHLIVENLSNQLYKEYTNRFRYYAHDMGRNFKVSMNIKL